MGTLITLTEKVCVIVLLGYVVSRAEFFRAYVEDRCPRVRDFLLTVGIFGLFSIYGTLGGTNIGNAVLNVRDAGPMIAGLVEGPMAGLLAGMIGGLHRLALGLEGMADWTGKGYTCILCTLSTVLVGWLAGLVRRRWGLLRIHWAVVFALLAESLHMLLGLLMAGDPAQWLTAASIADSWQKVISRAAIPNCQKRTVLSLDLEATNRPSGLKAMDRTRRVCPSQMAICWPVCTSQTSTVPPPGPVATRP